MQYDLTIAEWQLLAEKLASRLEAFCSKFSCDNCPVKECERRYIDQVMCDDDFIALALAEIIKRKNK